MHPKIVIVLLLVLALCHCCVGGPKKPSKSKKGEALTERGFPSQLTKSYNQIANDTKPINNDLLLLNQSNCGYASLPGLESVIVKNPLGVQKFKKEGEVWIQHD